MPSRRRTADPTMCLVCRKGASTMTFDRRHFLASSAATVLAASGARAAGDPARPTGPATGLPQARRQRGNRIGVSTYSFWQFRNKDLRDIETCIDLAAEMGFDGVEILHRQMTSETNDVLQRIKRRAFLNGLALCGFSTHQGFLSPDKAVRQKNVDHTIHCIELAYSLG